MPNKNNFDTKTGFKTYSNLQKPQKKRLKRQKQAKNGVETEWGKGVSYLFCFGTIYVLISVNTQVLLSAIFLPFTDLCQICAKLFF